VNFVLPVSQTAQKNVFSTLNNLFAAAGVGVTFSTSNPKADLNIGVGAILPGANYQLNTSQVLGYTPGNFFGDNYLNQGMIDLGQLLFLQAFHGANDAALGMAIGQVAAHELGHELGLQHSTFGGIMGPGMDPFVPSFFNINDKDSIFRKCQQLRGKQ
jgi:hypothetical protein